MNLHPDSDTPRSGGGHPVWPPDPDRRAAEVDRIQAELDAGDYEVPALDVAEAILRFYEREFSEPPSAGPPG